MVWRYPTSATHFAHDVVEAQIIQKINGTVPGPDTARIGQVDDLHLVTAFDCGVRSVRKTAEALEGPVITARLSSFALYTLLNDHPFAVMGDDESVQIKIAPILHGGHFRHEATSCRQRSTIETNPVTNGHKFGRCVT